MSSNEVPSNSDETDKKFHDETEQRFAEILKKLDIIELKLNRSK